MIEILFFTKRFNWAALLRDEEFCKVEDYFAVPRAVVFDKLFTNGESS